VRISLFGGDTRSVPIDNGLPAATIIASFSHSSCNECGHGCNPHEKKHITRPRVAPGGGCGIEFTHITTQSSVARVKDAARAMRPDLEFIEFPTTG
jgi:hypothetical protein